ncbi:sulfatase-like hydrolase/transferase [Roseiconus nitratireducens]|uniref:Sulfatase-like hydrolase/transferase n=1 Tax=Roseiconus nitratireducens TaxID=2605748 RepID=A0A5M6D7M4_9BACT|nr:sulfatase-like hydrolase/transferase [Roseiconus nitratireducens]KAA5542656.1 sulfatase-like hydrolase/transferase [Roseiconus nitratireducens]
MIHLLAWTKAGCRRSFPRHPLHRMVTLALAALAALAVQAVPSTVVQAEATDRPNVLLIMTDDQGWGDLGSHGNAIVQTPVLDSLAGESVELDRFYVSPVCAPTRAALLTGRYPERTGVAGVTGRREVMRAGETTMAEVFRDAGYATGCFGKWHNGAQPALDPIGQGFETFFGFCGGHTNLYHDAVLQRDRTPVQTRGYITDVLTNQAIDFLRRDRDQPFFCYVPYNAPHGPFQVPQELFDRYNTGEISEKTAAVYAMVENIDQNVGRLLAALDQQQVADDTIVIFLTDNGPNGKRFNGGMRGAKGSVHEGGCRVPCLIRWPAKLTPRHIAQITAHIDLLPTLAEWCGLSVESKQPLDGQSLAQLIAEGSDPALTDRTLLTYRPDKSGLESFGRAAARTNRFRLTIEKGKTALFDMQADPGQDHDVAEQYPDVAQQLRGQIDRYVETVTPVITAPRPAPISPRLATFLPAVDAQLDGDVQFANGNGWAHDWIDRWQSPQDRIAWTIRVPAPGRYHLRLHYVSPQGDAEVVAAVGESETTTRLKRSAPDRRVRPDLDSESTPRLMQSFGSQSLGTVDVGSGVHELTLRRTAEGGEPLEVGGITVTRAEIPAKDKFHLFVLAGQSNMAGRANVLPEDELPDPRILMLDASGQWIPAVDPVHFDKSVAGVGLGRAFARQLAKANPDVTIGLIPCAVGGSPISSWQPGGFHDQTRSHPYDDAVERIKLAQQQGSIQGILWHQGESDSNPNRAAQYHAALKELFVRLRDLVGQDTPIVIGQLAQPDDGQWSDARQRVDQAHRDVAKELSAAAFVPSDGLTLRSDGVHFDRRSLVEFGKRYARAFQSLGEQP